jgi:hypothetical protein
MWRIRVGSPASDDGLNPRAASALTTTDRRNINDVERYLENRLERGKITRSEIGDNGKVENHFQEQLAQTPTEQLESVRATHEQFWQDLRMDRDSYIKQVVGTNGLSRFAEPHFTNRVLDRRGSEICRGKRDGVEVPNIDPQASPRFASLSSSGVKHVKQPVSTAERGKEQVCIIEQPVVNKEASKDGLILLGVCGAVGIGVVLKYSEKLTKSVKNLLKKWFGSD